MDFLLICTQLFVQYIQYQNDPLPQDVGLHIGDVIGHNASHQVVLEIWVVQQTFNAVLIVGVT